MKTPLAKPGVTLPNGLKLRKSKIRGVVSNGMLCSAVELGLGAESDGIIHLPEDAPVGEPLTTFLNLPDASIDLSLTPNRGDCFSVLGIARDVAALSAAPLKDATVECRRGRNRRCARGRDSPAGGLSKLCRPGDPRHRPQGEHTGLDAVERLRRSGLRGISPVVDITNYVMLELGQPLHAYDLGCVQGAIQPRMAKKGEQLTLLDEKEITVGEDTLVISDDSGAIGMAGIMGGLSTAVERALVMCFSRRLSGHQRSSLAGRDRTECILTHRCASNVALILKGKLARAVERATEFLLQICGGKAGPLTLKTASEFLPKSSSIRLRRARLSSLLGVTIDDDTVVAILERLGMQIGPADDGWDVLAPAFRFDIACRGGPDRGGCSNIRL